MVEVKVDPGICGLKTFIRLSSEDMQTASLEIDSECPSIRNIAAELKEVDGFEECFKKITDSEVYRLAGKYCRHTACPVPAAVIKGLEVICGLALPKNVKIQINKLDD